MSCINGGSALTQAVTSPVTTPTTHRRDHEPCQFPQALTVNFLWKCRTACLGHLHCYNVLPTTWRYGTGCDVSTFWHTQEIHKSDLVSSRETIRTLRALIITRAVSSVYVSTYSFTIPVKITENCKFCLCKCLWQWFIHYNAIYMHNVHCLGCAQ